MTRVVPAAILMPLAFGVAGLAADDKSVPPEPDWSGYVRFSEVTGKISKLEKNGFVFHLTWTETSGVQNNQYRPGAIGALAGGGLPRASHMSARVRTQVHHEDVHFRFAEAGLVRWHKLTMGPGAGGKFVTEAEQNRLKLPAGAPGWAADRSDLRPGQVVEVTLVRPKDVPLAKATPADLRVKYAVIHTQPEAAAAGKKK